MNTLYLKCVHINYYHLNSVALFVGYEESLCTNNKFVSHMNFELFLYPLCSCYLLQIVTMETFFGKRSLLINIKIKPVMNKNIFLRDISIYFLKSFSSNNFYKILREK